MCLSSSNATTLTFDLNFFVDEADLLSPTRKRSLLKQKSSTSIVSRRHGEKGLPGDTINVKMTGSACQSFGAFSAPGVFFELEDDSNDYVGKGLSGCKLVICPSKNTAFKSEGNVMIGNVLLYDATFGQAFFRGAVVERFCVRNSGAGDHGCEYMTGGRVLILGNIGRNFVGGTAYLLDLQGDLRKKFNLEMVALEAINDIERIADLHDMIEDHRHYTDSEFADRILKDFNTYLPTFVMVMPIEYRNLLIKEREEKEKTKQEENPTAPVE